jgi:hypothetical protein
VTSYERRGRADGPALDRGDFTTTGREKQHPPDAGSGGVRIARPPRSMRRLTFPEREMNGDREKNAAILEVFLDQAVAGRRRSRPVR